MKYNQNFFKFAIIFFITQLSASLILCAQNDQSISIDSDIGDSETNITPVQQKQKEVSAQHIKKLKGELMNRLKSIKTFSVASRDNFKGSYHKKDIEEVYGANDDFVSYLGFLGDSAKQK